MFVVNSLSSPPTNWDASYSPPGTVDILLKSAGTPIDAFSYETIELLRDTAAHWHTMRLLRNSAAFAANKDPAWPQPFASRRPRFTRSTYRSPR